MQTLIKRWRSHCKVSFRHSIWFSNAFFQFFVHFSILIFKIKESKIYKDKQRSSVQSESYFENFLFDIVGVALILKLKHSSNNLNVFILLIKLWQSSSNISQITSILRQKCQMFCAFEWRLLGR